VDVAEEWASICVCVEGDMRLRPRTPRWDIADAADR